MSIVKYYPPITDLIKVDDFPQGLQSVENLLNEGLETVLGQVRYKDYFVQVLKSGEQKYYSLTLLTKSIRLPLFADMNLVFFQSEDENLAEFPITFEWVWPLAKYISGFRLNRFSYLPEAFVDIFLRLAEIEDKNQLFSEIVEVFLNDGSDSYVSFFNSFKTKLDTYKTTDTAVNQLVEDIKSQVTIIEQEVTTQLTATNFFTIKDLFDNYKNSPVLGPAVEEIETSIVTLRKDHNILIDLFGDVLSVLLEGASGIDEKFERLIELFQSWLNGITREDIEAFLIPQFKLELANIKMGIEFPRNWLIPLDDDDNVIEDENIKSKLTFTAGSVSYDTKKGFEFINENSFSFTNSQIGNTGFRLGFDGMKLDLSKDSNIPEATAAGYPDDFVGVFVREATIGFPPFWQKDEANSTAEIFGENMLIGTGGISGRLGLRALTAGDPSPLLKTNFGDAENGKGFGIALDQFSLTFQQNSIIESNICGTLSFPAKSFNKIDDAGNVTTEEAEIGVNVNIVNDEFTVTATPSDELLKVGIKDVLDFEIQQIQVGKQEDRFFLATSGVIEFKVKSLESVLPKSLEMRDLKIWSDGQIELPRGGFVELRKPIKMKFGPAEFSITGIHLGSEERFKGGQLRKYRYFGFDGGLSVDPGGVDARGSGLKFYYSIDDGPFDFFMRLESIAVDIIVPGDADEETAAALISGFLSIKDDDGVEEYAGGISLQLPKLEVAGSAAMRYRPSVPSFAIDVALDFSTPIVLGPTGMGIYGLRGLVGSNFIVDKNPFVGPEGKWYDFYKLKVPPNNREGIEVNKLVPEKGFTVGLGASLASAFDGGKVVSTKLMVIISPRLFYLEGQIAILKERVKLSDTRDLPFFVILIISDESVYAAFGVNYLLPEEDGSILKINGQAELEFFYENANAWYVNIGTKEQPITAQALSTFRAQAYLQMSVAGIDFGFATEFPVGFGSSCFGIRGEIAAGLDGKISFKPIKLGAFFYANGSVGVKIFCVGLDIGIGIGLGVQAPKPVLLCGTVEVSPCVKIWRFKKCATLKFNFKLRIGRPALDPPLEFLDATSSVQAVNMMTGDLFPIIGSNSTNPNIPLPALPNAINDYSVPMDSYLAFEFTKGVAKGDGPSLNQFGWELNTGGNFEYIPPTESKEGRNSHTYTVEAVEIYAHKDGTVGSNQWEPYQVYNSLVPVIADDLINPAVADTLKYGSFQIDASAKQNKMMLMQTNPFAYVQNGTKGPILEYLGLTVDNLFCGGTTIEEFCDRPGEIGLSEFTAGTRQVFNESGAFITTESNASVATANNPFNITQGLHLKDGNKAIIDFPTPSNQVSFKLTTLERVNITYIQRRQIDNADPLAPPTFEEVIIRTDEYQPSQLFQTLTYADENAPLSRVIIENIDQANQGTSVVTCSTPDATEVSNVLTLLNGMAGDGSLDTWGRALTIDTQVTNHLPASIANCQLNLTFERTVGKAWKIKINRLGRNVLPKILELQLGPIRTVFARSTKDKEEYVEELVDFLNDRYGNTLEATKLNSSELLVVAKNPLLVNVRVRLDINMRAKATSYTGVAFRFADIDSFENLVPNTDTLTEGGNFGFKVEANMSNGLKAVLTGETDCFRLICCDGATVNHYQTMCTSAELQIQTLTQQTVTIQSQISNLDTICELLTATGDPNCVRQGEEICEEINTLTTQTQQINQQITSLQTWIDQNCTDISGSVCNGTLPMLEGSYLFEFCWLKTEDYVYNNNVPSVIEAQQETSEFIQTITQTIQPIWRADTEYLVRVRTRDTVSNGGPGVPSNFVSDIMFRTEGPVGHFHQRLNPPTGSDGAFDIDYRKDYEALLDEGNEDQYKLADLKQYVDYDKSYPNADGSIVNSKPLYYYDPKLYLFFRRNYMKTMFNGFRAIGSLSELHPDDNKFFLEIADPSSADVIVIEEDKQGFKPNRRPTLSRDMLYMLNLLEVNPCSDAEVQEPAGQHFEADLVELLEPERLYTALYKATFREAERAVVVHRYNFQTSRYASFAEHINSYKVPNEDTGEIRNAFFDIKLSNTGRSEALQYDMSVVFDIIDDTLADDDPLRTTFGNRYDRLLNGGLKLTGLEEPPTTEVNFVRDYNEGEASSDHIIGILLRSPEAFNDPKIGEERIAQAIRVLDANGNVDASYDRIIVAKDAAKVFISNAAHRITDRSIQVEIDYLIYDPDQGFVVLTSEVIPIEVAQYETKLIDADCGSTERELTDTLTAFGVEDLLLGSATDYTFHLFNSEVDHTVVTTEPVLNLSQFSDLDYNRTYDVEVNTTLPDRNVSFGDVCQVSTKQLTFTFASTLPDALHTGTDINIRIELRFNDGSLFDYNGDITLEEDLDGTTASTVLTMVNGAVEVSKTLSSSGMLAFALVDSANTLYSVDDPQQIQVVDPATQLVFQTVQPTYSIGVGHELVIEAQSTTGAVDILYAGTAELTLGNESLLINFNEGISKVTATISESKILSLFLISTDLQVPAPQDVAFIPGDVSNYSYGLSASPSGTVTPGADVTVTIEVFNGGTLEASFELPLDLQIQDINGTRTERVDLTDGSGALIINSAVPDTITITLQEVVVLGITIPASIQIEVAN